MWGLRIRAHNLPPKLLWQRPRIVSPLLIPHRNLLGPAMGAQLGI